MIAGRRHYYTAHGQLPGVREIESQRNAGAVAAADAAGEHGNGQVEVATPADG
jgi:hypothetical protein